MPYTGSLAGDHGADRRCDRRDGAWGWWKVWARHAVPVMVLVDEDEDTIERVATPPG